jgi:hypothetical protein
MWAFSHHVSATFDLFIFLTKLINKIKSEIAHPLCPSFPKLSFMLTAQRRLGSLGADKAALEEPRLFEEAPR